MVAYASLIRKPALPVHGLTRWIARPDADGHGLLRINNVNYAFSEYHDAGKVSGYRLLNLETEESYDIDRAFMECSCMDAIYRRRSCKHSRAVTVALAALTK